MQNIVSPITFIRILDNMKQLKHKLTHKEEEIMNFFWDKGPMFIRELRDLYPEPKPHFNTLSTFVRHLQDEGYISHISYGPTYQYYAAVSKEDYNKFSLNSVVDKYFGKSYLKAVSAFVKEEKISLEQLKELVRQIEDEDTGKH